VARERLQILLAHERFYIGSSDLLVILRDELLATIARYVEFDQERLSVNLERAGSVSTVEIDVEVPSERASRRLAAPARPGCRLPEGGRAPAGEDVRRVNFQGEVRRRPLSWRP
jgi:cell division topological specificity factor